MAVSLAPATPGFADVPRDSQKVFRAVMNALARPATLQPLPPLPVPPPPLTPELAAVALTLCDGDAPVWLDAVLAAEPAVAAWLRFHTGAAVVSDPADASFALVADAASMPPLSDFAIGTEEFPDRSTTLVIAVENFHGAETLALSGPGVKRRALFAPCGLPVDFPAQWRSNRALFPRGVDLLLAGGAQVAGLPRSARLVAEG